jgi:hypothetical protein
MLYSSKAVRLGRLSGIALHGVHSSRRTTIDFLALAS